MLVNDYREWSMVNGEYVSRGTADWPTDILTSDYSLLRMYTPRVPRY
jgi:hypothetical protein